MAATILSPSNFSRLLFLPTLTNSFPSAKEKTILKVILPLTASQTDYTLLLRLRRRGKKVKITKYLLLVISILFLSIGTGCAKRVVQSEATPFTPLKMESKAATVKSEEKAAEKSLVSPPDSSAAQERERKIREETLREETLREKAARERALREEAARREALAREAALKKTSLESVYFDYDQAIVREDQKEIMMKNAQWLKSNPQIRVKIEGNCDERGTAEYNLALGQRRADTVKDFLEGLGIVPKRMQAISYGFERPKDPGHDEAAWAKNRRADFVPIR